VYRIESLLKAFEYGSLIIDVSSIVAIKSATPVILEINGTSKLDFQYGRLGLVSLSKSRPQPIRNKNTIK
tara:strand:- start:323 stop:532 length:210 start_codon:yes stop_codon:yes gene_type:complete